MLQPIIILAVPRSGSTLLRLMVGAHPDIIGLPETPWLLGWYGPEISLRGLVEHLSSHQRGVTSNISGVERQDVLAAARSFVFSLLERKTSGARFVVIKTPDDVRYLDFLLELFPDAKYLHLTRDGRDVALSTLKAFPDGLNGYGPATWENALLRWTEFERRIRDAYSHMSVLALRYEELVSDPEIAARRVCEFLELPYSPAMVAYDRGSHDLPQWEAGSRDVLRRDGIDPSSISLWKRARPTPDMVRAVLKHERTLTELGYEPSGLSRSDVPLHWFVTSALSAASARLRNRRIMRLARRLVPPQVARAIPAYKPKD